VLRYAAAREVLCLVPRDGAHGQEIVIMGEAFRLGGWGMFPTMFFGVLLIAASIRFALSPERRFVPLQVSLGIMTLASGGLGFVTGMIASVSSLEGNARGIWLIGMGESLHNVALAFALVTLGGVAASVGALRIARTAPEAGALQG
jgi:hypothetical protein